MTMLKVLHSRDDTLLRKEERRGLGSIVVCVDAIIQGFKKYTKNSKERLITVASNSNVNQKRNNKTRRSRKPK